MKDYLTDKVLLRNKLNILLDFIQGLQSEIQEVTAVSNYYHLKPNFYDYSLANTTPNAMHILCFSLGRYLRLFWFILDDLNMTVVDSVVIRNTSKHVVSFQEMLRKSMMLQSMYQAQLLGLLTT